MEYSDHAPLHIILDVRMPGQTTHKPQYGSARRVCKWRSEYVAQCREALLNSDRINSFFTHVTSQECLDENIDNFTETLYDIMEPFCKTYTKKTNESVQVENRLHNEKNLLSTEANQKPWFNDTLVGLYRDYKNALIRFNHSKSIENHENLNIAKRIYKDQEKILKRSYLIAEGNRLSYMRRNNSKCFFAKFAKKKRVTPSSITLKNFHDYFKNMTNVEDNELEIDMDYDSDMDLNTVVFEE